MKLALFDFDGTITSRDSFLDFLLYAHGFLKGSLGLALLTPVLLAYKIRVIPNWKAKEIVLRFFFEGWPKEAFEAVADSYASKRLNRIIRQETYDRIKWHQEQGHKVAVVTASVECWIKGWCRENDLDLIATQIEIKNDKVTGKLSTKNCYGEEKVVRIREKYNLDDYQEIFTYGNSRGDREMMQLSKRSISEYDEMVHWQ